MKTLQNACSCTGGTGCCDDSKTIQQKEKRLAYSRILLGLVGAGIWYQLYNMLEPLSKFITFNLLGLSQGSHLGDAGTVLYI